MAPHVLCVLHVLCVCARHVCVSCHVVSHHLHACLHATHPHASTHTCTHTHACMHTYISLPYLTPPNLPCMPCHAVPSGSSAWTSFETSLGCSAWGANSASWTTSPSPRTRSCEPSAPSARQRAYQHTQTHRHTHTHTHNRAGGGGGEGAAGCATQWQGVVGRVCASERAGAGLACLAWLTHPCWHPCCTSSCSAAARGTWCVVCACPCACPCPCPCPCPCA